MKKLSYRDKLIKHTYIYDVSKDYEKVEKFNIWSIRTYLKKNKITIPKILNNFFRDNIIKPVGKINQFNRI